MHYNLECTVKSTKQGLEQELAVKDKDRDKDWPSRTRGQGLTSLVKVGVRTYPANNHPPAKNTLGIRVMVKVRWWLFRWFLCGGIVRVDCPRILEVYDLAVFVTL